MRAVSVVDFFAGPGGLGEGFSSLVDWRGRPVFRIELSVEKEAAARRTLRLRSFARQFPQGEIPESYYRYVKGQSESPFDLATRAEWEAADEHALQGALGDPAADEEVDRRLAALKLGNKEWVLVGGPPCQAYSLVGRSRNAGIADYRAEDDDRHFLYRQYLRVLEELRPPVFVFENVQGILSSSVGGQKIFRQILSDLSDPSTALRTRNRRGAKYNIRSLCTAAVMEPGANPADINWREFLVRAEQLGVPQARHRVILIGVRSDLDPEISVRAPKRPVAHVEDVIGGLPRLRSGLSTADSESTWREAVLDFSLKVQGYLGRVLTDRTAREIALTCGIAARDLPKARASTTRPDDRSLRRAYPALAAWYADKRLGVTLNHEARGHMQSDLGRYLFCAAYARLTGQSPTSHQFPAALAPAHDSWDTGNFADRFRVQLADAPATTITSHIAKDGHYFIHYDPAQCRSLTVREAARLQTFPDNYYFEGNRTQQYVQVGNAVPPLLAKDIATVVGTILGRS